MAMQQPCALLWGWQHPLCYSGSGLLSWAGGCRTGCGGLRGSRKHAWNMQRLRIGLGMGPTASRVSSACHSFCHGLVPSPSTLLGTGGVMAWAGHFSPWEICIKPASLGVERLISVSPCTICRKQISPCLIYQYRHTWMCLEVHERMVLVEDFTPNMKSLSFWFGNTCNHRMKFSVSTNIVLAIE